MTGSQLEVMDFVLILVFGIAVLIPFGSGMDILFPTSPILKWSLADLSKIDCNTGGYQDIGRQGLKIKSYAPLLRQNYTSDGYLCIKSVLITECSEGFFGGQTVSYKTESSRITYDECYDAVMDWSDGEYKSLEHPPASCSWMRTSAETSTRIEVRPHTVLFDPYEAVKISDLFLTGKCKSFFCPTSKEGVVWISQDNQLPHCLKETLSPVYVFAREKGDNHYSFWSPDFPLQSNKRMCLKDFCGMTGFMFDDGSWIGIPKEEIPKKDKLGEYLYKVERCERTSLISAQPEEILIHTVEHTVFSAFLKKECEKTKERLMSGESLSRIELQTLTPRTPGRFMVYRLLNGSLLQSISDYQWVTVTTSPHRPYISFILENQGKIEWLYWSYNEALNLTEGPNGLYIRGKQLIYPGKSISDYEHLLQSSIKQRISISSSGITNIPHHLRHHIVIYPNFNDTAITEVIANTFSFSFWTSHVSVAIIVLIGIVLVCRLIALKLKYRGMSVVRYDPSNPGNPIKIYSP